MNDNERAFKAQYVAAFLAMWTVHHYDQACALGTQAMLHDPPVEDAMHLANTAWRALAALTGDTPCPA